MRDDTPQFELGLVMAGAISAGAYTAGVVDFLLEALAAWDTVKEDDKKPGAVRRMPDHGVRLKALAGASAGAITAAILVRALATRVSPVTDVDAPPDQPAPDPANETTPFANPFYAAWVQSIDIRHLLGDRDLPKGEKKVRSILDSSALPQIGNNVLRVAGDRRAEPPRYAANPVNVFLTTANLRGVPYGLSLAGQQVDYKHKMTAYADYSQFALTWPDAPASPPDSPHAIVLEPAGLGPGEPTAEWGAMMNAALASSAFPIGLAPRLLRRKATDYDRRDWQVPASHPLKIVPAPATAASENAPAALDEQQKIVSGSPVPRALECVCTATRKIIPAWPDGIRHPDGSVAGADPAYEYAYWNVDGGLMNNEPLELARRALADGKRNPREGDKATRAVVMVDPFPNTSDVAARYDADIDLVKVFIRMISALKEQARFKPEELALAADEDVYSRFVISPVAVDAIGEFCDPPIASAVMGGFGGFLSEEFRKHDFQLGRRNCQRFLERHLILPLANPLFATWRDDPTLQAKYAFRILPDGGVVRAAAGRNAAAADYEGLYAPIIPLVDRTVAGVDLTAEVPLPRRRTQDDVDFSDLRKRVRRRLGLVVWRLLSGVSPWWLRWPLLAAWCIAVACGLRCWIVAKLMDLIESETARLG
jgi:hypothetical protein